MTAPRFRRLVVLAILVSAVVAAVKALRGEPAPVFAHREPGDAPAPRSRPDAASSASAIRGSAARPAPAAEVRATPSEAHAEQAAPTPGATAAAASSPAAQPRGRRWEHPLAGDCPPGYPVKVKLTSGIYHVPGGFSYVRTNPDRCYATVEEAEHDGFRAAKR